MHSGYQCLSHNIELLNWLSRVSMGKIIRSTFKHVSHFQLALPLWGPCPLGSETNITYTFTSLLDFRRGRTNVYSYSCLEARASSGCLFVTTVFVLFFLIKLETTTSLSRICSSSFSHSPILPSTPNILFSLLAFSIFKIPSEILVASCCKVLRSSCRNLNSPQPGLSIFHEQMSGVGMETEEVAIPPISSQCTIKIKCFFRLSLAGSVW